MSYVSLEDDFHSNPKVLAAGLDGAGLYARALSYCGAHLTDGYLPRAWIMGATEGRRGPINKCLAAGLITELGEDYTIRDYLEHNPSREQVIARREERSEAGKKGAAKRWTGRDKKPSGPRGPSQGTSDSSSHSDSHGDSDSSQMANGWHSTPTPTPELQETPNGVSSHHPEEDDPLDEQAVQRVHAHWLTITGREQRRYKRISPERRRKIRTRLREFTVDELLRALDAVAADDWVDRAKHSDILVLFKSREKVEGWLDRADKPHVNGRGLTVEQIRALGKEQT